MRAVFRFVFTMDLFRQAGGVVSLSFVLSMPFACGALSVAIGRWLGSDNWVMQAVSIPLAALLLGLVICVIMAAPLLVTACVLDGIYEIEPASPGVCRLITAVDHSQLGRFHIAHFDSGEKLEAGRAGVNWVADAPRSIPHRWHRCETPNADLKDRFFYKPDRCETPRL